jgi:twinkle protein
VPTPWDINGSANFRNKADNCLTIWRDEDSPELPVKVYVQKVRFKNIGCIGMVELKWDRVTGRYAEPTFGDMKPLGGANHE